MRHLTDVNDDGPMQEPEFDGRASLRGRGAIRRAPKVEAALGSRIRAARVAVGMSQTALGAALGITFQQVQRYEIGKDRVAASTLQDIAVVLGVHPGSFFDDMPTTPLGSIHDVKVAVRIAERIQRVRDPRIVERLLALIDLLAGAEGDAIGIEKSDVTSDEPR